MNWTTYVVDISVRGHAAAYHVQTIFPSLTIRDCTPSFRQNRPGYEPTEQTRYSLEGELTSGHVDSLDLMNLLAFIGDGFLGLRMERKA